MDENRDCGDDDGVEAFIAEHGIDEKASEALRACPPEVNSAICDHSSMQWIVIFFGFFCQRIVGCSTHQYFCSNFEL